MPAMQPCLQPGDFLLMSQAVHLASRPTPNQAAVQRQVVAADAEMIGDDSAFIHFPAAAIQQPPQPSLAVCRSVVSLLRRSRGCY